MVMRFFPTIYDIYVMKVCKRCNRVNPDDIARCIECGRSEFEKLWFVPGSFSQILVEKQKYRGNYRFKHLNSYYI